VAAARVERETDPVCHSSTHASTRSERCPTASRRDRAAGTGWVAWSSSRNRFDHAVDLVVRLDSSDIGRLFELLDRIPAPQLEVLLRTIAAMPADEVITAADLMAGLPPAALGRLVGLARQPGVVRVLGAALRRGDG